MLTIPAEPSDQHVILVIERVYGGEMTPEQAEQWANQHGLAPFVLPPHELNNLSGAGRWPILLALAVIVVNNIEAGISSWKAYKFWRPGWQPQIEWIRAERGLLRALAAGKISAWGINPGTLERVLIPPHEWNDLTLQRLGQVGNVLFREEQSPRYVDVLLDAEKVCAYWKLGGARIQKARSTIDVETACKRELIRLMKTRPNHPESKSELRKKFPQVPVRGFNRAYSAAVQEANAPAWGAPGRRPKKP
jgi:hypothetical protein